MECKWCNQNKNEDQMVKKRGKFAAHCKECHKKKYGNPEQRRETHLKTRYGISESVFLAMFVKQSGGCAICLRKVKYKLHIDHNHTTGDVRGLLCASCNRAVGLLRDSQENARRMVDYLGQPQK